MSTKNRGVKEECEWGEKVKWREGCRKGEEKGKMIRRAQRGKKKGDKSGKVLLKKQKCNFNDNIEKKKTFMHSCYPDQDDTMIHCIFVNRQNTQNHVVPIFLFHNDYI